MPTNAGAGGGQGLTTSGSAGWSPPLLGRFQSFAQQLHGPSALASGALATTPPASAGPANDSNAGFGSGPLNASAAAATTTTTATTSAGLTVSPALLTSGSPLFPPLGQTPPASSESHLGQQTAVFDLTDFPALGVGMMLNHGQGATSQASLGESANNSGAGNAMMGYGRVLGSPYSMSQRVELTARDFPALGSKLQNPATLGVHSRLNPSLGTIGGNVTAGAVPNSFVAGTGAGAGNGASGTGALAAMSIPPASSTSTVGFLGAPPATGSSTAPTSLPPYAAGPAPATPSAPPPLPSAPLATPPSLPTLASLATTTTTTTTSSASSSSGPAGSRSDAPEWSTRLNAEPNPSARLGMGQFSTEAGARSGVFSAAGTAAASATSMALNLLNLAHGSGTASGQAAGAENGTWGSPYGMLGLLATIRSQNADLSLLAHGVDLTALGLNLNSAEPLYPSFSSPFGPDLSRNSAPLEDTRTDETMGNSLDAFAALPSCYSACTVSLKPAHFKRFSTETLILIFYGYPRDLVQVYAALELFNRGWRYHKELKTWFARSGPGVESLAPDPSDAKSISSSVNQLVYFDLHNWSLKPFANAGTLPNLMRGFLTEAELREMMAACK